LFLQGHPNGAGKTYVVGDLKPKEVEFLAVRDGALLYTREASRGETQGWKDFLLHELELAAGRIRLGPEDSIEKVVLAGEESESAHREVRDQIEDCDLIGSHVRFEMVDAQRAHLQEGATSIGLAYSGIMRRPPLRLNLLPAERRVQQTRWAYVPPIVLGLVVLALLGALALRPIIQRRIMVRKLDEEIQSVKGRADRVQTLRSQTEAMEKRLLNIEGLFRTQDMNLEVLQELTSLLPPDTFLNLYQNRDGTIQITGSSSSASDLVAKLERSPFLKNVNQRGTIFKDAQTGKDRFNFEAKLERTP
jgi:Tfp pilus assembly protein PilN